jgi:predicted ATPase/class 3 adenylate cyclase/tetratricopeptide (TPR) repeat protein
MNKRHSLVESPNPKPTGLVTFLFTDIEGSTQRWEHHPELMERAFSRHEEIIRTSMSEYNGYVYKMIGDAFQVAFSSAPAALNAAITAQRKLNSEHWGEIGSIKVRMALHTGKTEERYDDYVGPLLNKLSRLMSVAYGGQILTSQETRELIGDQTSLEVAWSDLGKHWLKDLKEKERIYQVVVPDLPSDFPPLPTVSLQSRTLPEHTIALIGRKSELDQIDHLLSTHRLITLHGPGGIGKTRLALASAEARSSSYRQGAHFVPLLSINTPTAIVPSIATVVGLTFLEGRTPQTQLLDHLRSRQILLVLDNMEHLLVDDYAEETLTLIETMLATAPALTILVTSRELLRLPEEKIFLVAGLPIGYEGKDKGIINDSAVELFCSRAQQANISINTEDLQLVRHICNLVEGMPLAIELAAAQLRLLSLTELTSEIERGLDILDSGMRGTGKRHRSMHVVVETSWQTLDAELRNIFARLSIFQGGFTPEAASHVANATISDLATLLEKSLIYRNTDGRFILHALIQIFITQKLAEYPEDLAETQSRQYHYYRQLLSATVSDWQGTFNPSSLDIIDLEVGNLRASWNWILSQNDWDATSIYMDDLWQYYKFRGRLPEAMELLDKALLTSQMAEPAPSEVLQAYWERRLGQAYLWLSQLNESEEHFRHAISLLEWPLPTSQTGLMLGVIKQILIQVLHRALPSFFIGRLDQKEAAIRETFFAYEELAFRAGVESEMLLSFYCYFRSLNLAEAAGLQFAMARAYASIGYIIGVIPLHKLAKTYLSKAEEIADVRKSVDIQECVSRWTGMYYSGVGELNKATRALDLAVSTADLLGHNWIKETTLLFPLFINYLIGNFDISENYALRVEESAHRRGDVGFEAAALYWQAIIKLKKEEMEEVLSLLEESASAPSEVMNFFDWSMLRTALSYAHLNRGQIEKAIIEAKKVETLLAKISRPSNLLYLYSYEGVTSVFLTLWELHIDSNNRQEFRDSARQACKDLQDFAKIFPIAKSQALHYKGLYDWLAGYPEKAFQAWDMSLVEAEKLGLLLQQGLVHYEIGRHLLGGKKTENGWGFQDHLQKAIEIFEQLGATFDLNRANTHLEKWIKIPDTDLI